MTEGSEKRSSGIGTSLLHSARVGEMEMAMIHVDAGTSLPVLPLPELEVLLINRGCLRWRRDRESRGEWHAPLAFVRRLDTWVDLHATEPTQLFSVRIPYSQLSDLPELDSDRGAWSISPMAADTARQLRALLLARQADDELLLRGLGLTVGWARLAASFDNRRASQPAWLSVVLMELDRRSETPTPQELAGHAGVSGAQLSRAFRSATGYSVGAFHRRLRVQRACEQMQQFQVPIAEVAANAGFSDHAHFSRIFKHVIGVSPSAYRSALHDPTRASRADRESIPLAATRSPRELRMACRTTERW